MRFYHGVSKKTDDLDWVLWIFLGLILFVILGIGVASGDGAANPAPVVVSVNRDIVPISK